MTVPRRHGPRAAVLLVATALASWLQWEPPYGVVMAQDDAGAASTTAPDQDVDDSSTLSVVDILLRLFDSTGGTRWKTSTHWRQDGSSSSTAADDEIDFCSYFGITCYPDTYTDNQRRSGQIQALDLPDNHLVGILPDAVFALPYLERLNVRGNPDLVMNMNGAWQAQFLRELIADETTVRNLTGIEASTALQIVDLSQSGLQGSFPAQLYHLSDLRELDVSQNLLSGSLSDDIGLSWEVLEGLSLDDNDFTGTIPTTIGNLAYLKSLGLSRNAFQGSLPDSLNACTNLEIFTVDREADNPKGPGLTGSLPPLSNWVNIMAIRLQHQRLSGSLPNDFLQYAPQDESLVVDLTGNQITGSVPLSLVDKTQLELYLADNQISAVSDDLCNQIGGWMSGNAATVGCQAFLCRPGTFATQGLASTTHTCETCNSTNPNPYFGATTCEASLGSNGVAAIDVRTILTRFYQKAGGPYWKISTDWTTSTVAPCNWYGVSCSSNQVTGLALKNNGLTGSIVTDIFQLPSLQILDLSANSIDFDFTGIQQASQLQILDLSQSDLVDLDGLSALTQVTSLRKFSIAGNNLQGNIPDSLFAISSLEELDISNNRFSGALSTSVGQLTKLTRFRCFGNHLSGQIPSTLGNLVNLVQLLASENKFSGTLPAELDNLNQLQILSFHQTTSQASIGGPLLPFPNLQELTMMELAGNALTGRPPADLLQNSLRASDKIELWLADNRLTGTVPGSWGSRFSELFVDLAGNQMSGIASNLCSVGSWMDGFVAPFSCDAILCPAGSYSDFGRQVRDTAPCETCPEAKYWGSKQCGSIVLEEDEIGFLVALYQSTNGDQWKNNVGWLKDDDCCGWYGVFCNAAGHVVRIALDGNGLTGQPDSSLFKLPLLYDINLRDNDILFDFTGIGQSYTLTKLVLANTNLNSISGLGAAIGLVDLDLSDNDLKGTFPSEVLALTELQSLLLTYNNFEGRIPPEIGSLSNLQEVALNHNRLDGQLPAALGSLSQLRTLDLSENNFEGTLPIELNDLTSLEILAIQRKGGTIGDDDVGIDQGDSQGGGIRGPLIAFDNLTSLKKLYLGANSLSGSIPFNFLGGITDKAATIEVDLISNQLTGEVPASLSRFEQMAMYLADNQISAIANGICRQDSWMAGNVGFYGCDAILCPPGTSNDYGRQTDDSSACQPCSGQASAPYYGSFTCLTADEVRAEGEKMILELLYKDTNGDNWRYASNWLDPDVSFCQWYGVTCVSGAASVESIDLVQNGLIGQLPNAIFQLSGLTRLNIAANDIQVSFSSLQSASKLQTINLESTGLRSVSGIENATGLKDLFLNDNLLGSFPSELMLIDTLEVIDLSGNDIGGSIPTSIASLSKLQSFSCIRCNLEGRIDGALGSLSLLEYLRLGSNGLFGSIPSELASLTMLRTLDISDQISSDAGAAGLNGTLPAFEGFKQLTKIYLGKNRLSSSIPESFLADLAVSDLVTIDLTENALTGMIPSVLGRFFQLYIYVANNKIDDIPSSLCSLGWNGYVGTNGSCDRILCGPGTFNGIGRDNGILNCESCPNQSNSTYYGQTSCGEELERAILIQLYRDLGGHEWFRSDGWNTNAPTCSWYGVECYDESSTFRPCLVKSLILNDNNLVGTVTPRVWLLTKISELNLRENKIDLSFEKIGDAVALKTLDLSQTQVKSLEGIGAANSLTSLHVTNNDMSGTLPDEIYQLLNIERLYLNYNAFSGTLSTMLGNLSRLKELYLSNNKLEGPIPEEIAGLIFIRVLSLGENKLSGTVPLLLSSMPFLEVLSLQQKPFVADPNATFNVRDPGFYGDLPPFNKNSQLRELNLADNSFGNTIPSDFLAGINDKERTIWVDLSHNAIQGSVPESLIAFSDLRLLLSDNYINEVPSEVCKMNAWMDGLLASGCDALLCLPGTFNQFGRRIESEDCHPCDYRSQALYYGSDFCGAVLASSKSEKEIVEEFYALADGEKWTNNSNWMSGLSVCKWYGISCETDGSGIEAVVGISLPFNNLVGVIPGLVFYLPSLRKLSVEGNDVKMSFREAKAARNLEKLSIDRTRITSIDGLEKAPNLRVLTMSSNSFGQSIPSGIFGLSQLERLDISNCGFIGTIAESVGNLAMLKYFAASDNSLSGILPDSLGTLASLEKLILSNNDLFGTIPTSLQSIQTLSTLLVDARQKTSAGLSGPLPPFERSPVLRNIDLGGNSLTGSIPGNLLVGLSNFSVAVNVFLDSNMLTGVIPSNLTRFDRLNIDLSGNEITGIAAGLCEKTDWWSGDVGRFKCGAILCPPGTFNSLGRESSGSKRCQDCPGEETSVVYGMKACGSLQKQAAKEILVTFFQATGGMNWKRRTGWLDDTVDICDWYGISCLNDNGIESVILGGNNLNGAVPSSVFELPGLKFLWLYSNPITFSFEGVEKASNLASIQLDSTGLSSLDGIGKATSLVDLDVRFNKLQGPLIDEIDELPNLETFYCGENRLSGQLPSFRSNRMLSQLRMAGNQFTGHLPSFSVHPNLKTIDVSGNLLDGAIPEDFLEGTDAALELLIDISDNSFSGSLPASLGRFAEVTIFARDNEIDSVHPSLCSEVQWNGGDVGAFGCDGILCPPQTFSPIGRASQGSAQCQPCESVEFYGSSTCVVGVSTSKSSVARKSWAWTSAFCGYVTLWALL